MDMHLEIFSSRAGSWKTIESPPHFSSMIYFCATRGSLTNEALHWLPSLPEPQEDTRRHTITAFDLAKEQFRDIPLPRLADTISDSLFFNDVGIVFEGCLCVSRYVSQEHGGVYVQLWVMMEYDVRESWTKLFKFKSFNNLYMLRIPIFYTERRIVMLGYDKYGMVDELRRFDHEEEDKLDKVAVCTGRYILEGGCCHMIEYDETLLWLRDSRAEGGKTTQNPAHEQKLK